jgi:tetratricopeptide (TPR) repeat protein
VSEVLLRIARPIMIRLPSYPVSLLPAVLLVCVSCSALQGQQAPPSALQQIQGLMQGGDLARARLQLMEVLKTAPRNPLALNMLGVVNAQEGQFRAAERCYLKAIGAAPDFVEAYLNLGRLYQENQHKLPDALKESLNAYESALKYDPSNVEANYQAAFVLWRRGSFRLSLDRLSRLSQAARERPQALALACADEAGMKDNGGADEIAERLLRQPDLVEADVTMITPTLLAQGQSALALRLLEGVDQRGLASRAMKRQLGLLYEQQGKLKRARATFEALAPKPEEATGPLLNDMARVAYKDKDLDGALVYLAYARKLEPENAATEFSFGVVCLEKDLVEEAYVALKKAAELEPDNPDYSFAAGVSMVGRRDVREAYAYLKKYCQLRPGDPRGHLVLGAAFFYGNDPDLAREQFESVANNRETAADAHYFLGRLANQEGKYTEAAQFLRQAIHTSPNYADAYAELGFSLVKMKEDAAAEQSLQKALKLNPANYTANLSLMMVYERTKDPRAAAQVARFSQVREQREQRVKDLMRTVEVRPY